MSVKTEFIEQASRSLRKLHPEWDKDQLNSALEHIWMKHLSDPYINIDNNVREETADTSLTKLCNWIRGRKPVVSGNATFYCQPEEHESPTSKMLRTMKRERKTVKSQLGNYKPGSDEYQMCDLTQMNLKVIMNAEYGGSGTPTAAFYTKYSPAATTLCAQSIITIMAAFFESYLGDNQKFYSLNECIDWMETVRRKAKEQDIPKWIVRYDAPSVATRIKSKFIRGILSMDGIDVINRYIGNCNSDELVYLYYANNFKDLIRNHSIVRNCVLNVLNNLPNYQIAIDSVPVEFHDKFNPNDPDAVRKYNKWIANEMFINPYKIPDCIKDDMDKFIKYMTQFVYVEYLTPDSIVRLNNHERNTVLLVDTDSNIINTNIFVQFILNEVFPGELFGRELMYNEMICVNIICATLSPAVALQLDFFGRTRYMNKEARAELTMKNEFMFKRLFLMPVKKRYAASIVLREGNIIIPFKAEIKGLDFIKSMVSDDVSKRFEKMLCDNILFPAEIDIHELMRAIKMFEREIDADLRNGGMTYLKHGQFKSMNAYAKPWTQQTFKGAMVWNSIYDDNPIYPLDKIVMVKTTITCAQDVEKIKESYPEIYNKIMTNIFMNGADPDLRAAGMKIVAVPVSAKKLPDWLIPFIDYNLVISNTIDSFRSVLKALDVEEISYKTPNGKASITSGIISL